MPFYSRSGDPDPPVKLVQTTAKDFIVVDEFSYVLPDRSRKFVVVENSATDLASIPPVMRWFVQTYGLHTRAAILHDTLWRALKLKAKFDAQQGAAASHGLDDAIEPILVDPIEYQFEGREVDGVHGWFRPDRLVTEVEANQVFRVAMEENKVPWFQRWVMWAAVSLGGRWNAKGWQRAGVLLFLAIHALIAVLLVLALVGVTSWSPFGVPLWWVPVVWLLLPVLFGRQIGAGLIGTGVLAVVEVPLVGVFAALAVLSVFMIGRLPIWWRRRQAQRDNRERAAARGEAYLPPPRTRVVRASVAPQASAADGSTPPSAIDEAASAALERGGGSAAQVWTREQSQLLEELLEVNDAFEKARAVEG